MKFECKFGIGEIVYHTRLGHSKAQHDEFLEVIAITFDNRGVFYHCRYPNGIVGHFSENELIGDPDYNQETGGYDYDVTGYSEAERQESGQ